MIIGLDLDEVTAEFVDEILKFYNNKKGKNHTKDEIKEYAFWVAWKISKEEAMDIVEEFHQTHKIEEMMPVKGAIESISELIKNGDKIYIITARPNKFKEKTEEWVKHHLKTDKIKVIIAGDFYKGQAASKAEICKDLNVDIMLEDTAEIAIKCAKAGIKVILFDKPWNKTLKHQNVKRVKSWIQALKILKKRK